MIPPFEWTLSGLCARRKVMPVKHISNPQGANSRHARFIIMLS